MDAPLIQYCRTDDGVDIAYWSLGEGPAVILINPIVLSHIALEWEVPSMRQYYLHVAETFRVVRYGPRCGALSGEGDLTHDGNAADLVAVADAIGEDKVALLPATHGVL